MIGLGVRFDWDSIMRNVSTLFGPGDGGVFDSASIFALLPVWFILPPPLGLVKAPLDESVGAGIALAAAPSEYGEIVGDSVMWLMVGSIVGDNVVGLMVGLIVGDNVMGLMVGSIVGDSVVMEFIVGQSLVQTASLQYVLPGPHKPI